VPEPLCAAVAWRDGLEIVDQTLLPGRYEVRRLTTVEDTVEAIRTLAVRGAPAIGVCGGYAVVVGLDEAAPTDRAAALAALDRVAAELAGARPTAVNLRWAVERVAAAARRGADPAGIRAAALAEAHAIAEEDREACRRIGVVGRKELTGARRVLTHCNAGRLATAGTGTALSPIYAMAAAGEPVEVLVGETRPLLQGARLTAWELSAAGVPVTLVADTAAGAAFAAGRVDAVVVGADRVAANGDTANKIGTYPLAVLAREHDVPFYVAAPRSTFDLATPTGAGIVIEERPAGEVRGYAGRAVAPDVKVWNPAFDVTPARFVTAFLTDLGVLRPPYPASIAAALR
jgi:methylthioribose-1-phosphate isomerase